MKRLIVLLGICMILLCSNAFGLMIYINKSNPACNNGNSRAVASNPSTPWCDTASWPVDGAVGSDLLTIADGIYFDKMKLRNRVGGITVRGHPGNDVILTRADEGLYNSSTTWINVSSLGGNFSVWRAPIISSYNCLVGFVNDTNEAFYPACVDYTYCVNSACSGSPNMNFAWWNNTVPYDSIWHDNPNNVVYIKFIDLTANPNDMSLHIGGDHTITLESMNINTTTIANLTIHSFQTGLYFLGAGIQNFSIYNISFEGFGRRTIQISGSAGNITISGNNGTFVRRQDWSWRYEHDVESDFIWLENAKDNIKILDNDITGYTNGIIPRYLAGYGLPINDFYGLEIAYNRFNYITDDALEPEDYANCYDIHHNNITNAHVVMTLTPSNSSTCFSHFYENLAIANFSVVPGTIRTFKFSGGSDQASGWNITGNTLYGDDAIIQAAIGNNILVNFTFKENLFYSDNANTMIQRTGTPADDNIYDYNLYYSTSGNFARYWSSDADATTFANLADAKAGGNWDTIWDINSIWADPLFIPGTYQMYSDSPGCTLSESGSYVGALPCSANATPTPPVPTPSGNQTTGEQIADDGLKAITNMVIFLIPIILIVILMFIISVFKKENKIKDDFITYMIILIVFAIATSIFAQIISNL